MSTATMEPKNGRAAEAIDKAKQQFPAVRESRVIALSKGGKTLAYETDRSYGLEVCCLQRSDFVGPWHEIRDPHTSLLMPKGVRHLACCGDHVVVSEPGKPYIRVFHWLRDRWQSWVHVPLTPEQNETLTGFSIERDAAQVFLRLSDGTRHRLLLAGRPKD